MLPASLPQGPDQQNQVWILDVHGTRLVIIVWSFPEDPVWKDRTDLDEMLASIEIGCNWPLRSRMTVRRARSTSLRSGAPRVSLRPG